MEFGALFSMADALKPAASVSKRRPFPVVVLGCRGGPIRIVCKHALYSVAYDPKGFDLDPPIPVP